LNYPDLPLKVEKISLTFAHLLASPVLYTVSSGSLGRWDLVNVDLPFCHKDIFDLIFLHSRLNLAIVQLRLKYLKEVTKALG
jgi:hypothetical protein